MIPLESNNKIDFNLDNFWSLKRSFKYVHKATIGILYVFLLLGFWEKFVSWLKLIAEKYFQLEKKLTCLIDV